MTTMMTAAVPAAGAAGQYESWRAKRIPAVEEIRPGIWSLPTPMPDNPLRYVIAYAARVDDGIVLFDSGWLSEQSWASLNGALDSIGYSVADVRMVLITHTHADHHGLTRRIAEASGATVGMHRTEAESMRTISESISAHPKPLDAWLRERGAPADEVDVLTAQMADDTVARIHHSLIAPDLLIEDGDRPVPGRPDIRAIATPGHTQGHLCFLFEDDRLLLSGDHILPRITPHVTRPPDLDDDALGSYLDSLAKVASLEVDEVLPAHEYRFSDLEGRVTDLIAHHRERLDEIRGASRGGRSTWEIATQISWSRGWDATHGFMRQTALSETFSHLRYLERIDSVRRSARRPDHWHPTS